MSRIDRIISKGENITEHYLGETNENFEIYRYRNEVYAIRYQDREPVDYVSMWKSNKYKITNEDPYKVIGKGVEGVVYQKTKDKAMKKSNKIKVVMAAAETNNRILQQKFFLKDHDIQDYFVLGLWNIKDEENFPFYMPKEVAIYPTDDQTKYDDFIMALKILNDSGYWHGDLANSHLHNSPQNLIETEEFVKAVDIDGGFGFVKEELTNNNVYINMLSKYRDQWIFVYNYKFPPIDQYGDKAPWRNKLDDWYDINKGQSLSDSPDVLIRFCHEGKLSLPQNFIVNKNEELSRDLKPKKKSQKVKKTLPFFSEQKLKAYEGIRDVTILKSVILQDLANSIADITTPEELEEKRSDFFNSPEMEVLSKVKGIAFRTFDLSTSHQKKVKKIFEEAKERIQIDHEEEAESTHRFFK